MQVSKTQVHSTLQGWKS